MSYAKEDRSTDFDPRAIPGFATAWATAGRGDLISLLLVLAGARGATWLGNGRVVDPLRAPRLEEAFRDDGTMARLIRASGLPFECWYSGRSPYGPLGTWILRLRQRLPFLPRIKYFWDYWEIQVAVGPDARELRATCEANPSDHATIGRLLGFPPLAAAAFENRGAAEVEDLPAELAVFGNFIPAPGTDGRAEELATLERWRAAFGQRFPELLASLDGVPLPG